MKSPICPNENDKSCLASNENDDTEHDTIFFTYAATAGF